MGHLIRLKHGLLVKLANHYTTQGVQETVYKDQLYFVCLIYHLVSCIILIFILFVLYILTI